MTSLKILAALAGVAVISIDLLDLVRALIVPRPHVGGIVAWSSRGLRRLYGALAARRRTFGGRDAMLSAGEPLILLWRLLVWLALGLAGFGLIIWSVGRVGFEQSFVESGSSIFTLGIASEPGAVPSLVAFLAAGFGLVVVALQIAYLPALYDAFNRRETLVTLLESRAGTPAWGPELLARHALVGIEGNLPRLYADWERWSADVAESHTTYPALLWLRSPHPTNSWVVSLVAVLDSAAMLLALNPATAPPEARLAVRMGFTCLRDIARVIRIPFDADPMPDSPIGLPFGDFAAAVDRLGSAGMTTERTAAEAWPDFVGWRVNYEAIAYALAARIDAPPGPWTGPRPHEREGLNPLRPIDRRPDQPEGTPATRREPGPTG